MFTADDVYQRFFVDRPDFYDHAACRGHHKPELWFADNRRAHRRGRYDPQTLEAITVCRSCPVRDACLEHALANHEHIGVWGARTAEERREMMRVRGRVGA